MSGTPMFDARSRRRIARGLVLPVALLIAWELASRTGLVDPRFLPSLESIVRTGWTETVSGALLGHLGASLARNLTGFAIGTLLGIAVGSLLGLSRAADRLLGPTFHAAKQIAVLAWIPIISIWFGFAETAKIVFIAIAAFVPVVLNAQEGVQSASAQLVEVAHALRFSRRQLLRRVLLPAALPSILTGVHLALIYSWLATVGAEYFMTVGPGIGGLIIAGRERFQMDLVMLGVVILGLIGFTLNHAASRLEARLLRWRDG
ncbi:MAG TPA: ABC transporter permease [Xanthobacteraceae bacterium]|nr:ABC transporter permease [Xanthobacteraceae bacterium]